MMKPFDRWTEEEDLFIIDYCKKNRDDTSIDWSALDQMDLKYPKSSYVLRWHLMLKYAYSEGQDIVALPRFPKIIRTDPYIFT